MFWAFEKSVFQFQKFQKLSTEKFVKYVTVTLGGS